MAIDLEKKWQGSVAKTIEFLINEGKPKDQAAAIAYRYAREKGLAKSADAAIGLRVQFAKLDDAKRIVTAWASVVTKADGRPIDDFDGERIAFDDLEEAFAKSFADGGQGKGGEMHVETGKADIIGQITLSRDERIALGFGPGPEGAVVKVRIKDDGLWKRIASGELSEMSIGGTASVIETPEEEAA